MNPSLTLSANFERRTTCRLCGHTELTDVLDLGIVPLADGFITVDELALPEPRFPLNVTFCSCCSLLQLRETVDPQVLFCDDYPYYSSVSDSWLTHCRNHAAMLIASQNLDRHSRVVEIASNDGYQLRHFAERGIGVLGIDPAEGPSDVAREQSIPIVTKFFTASLAEELRSEGTLADVILAKNVLAHVDEMNDLVQGMSRLLKPHGVIVIEVPYVRPLVEQCEFDTIYHEHLAYFSVTALAQLFSQHGLTLRSVVPLSTHGGSIRLVVDRGGAAEASVARMIHEESVLGFRNGSRYVRFARNVRQSQEAVRDYLEKARTAGRTVAAYAASAKGCSLLNTSGIEAGQIAFAVDRSPHKQGKLIPGVRVPILAPEELLTQMPDDVLLLAWNLRNEILAQQSEYVSRGGQFVVPIPKCHIIGGPQFDGRSPIRGPRRRHAPDQTRVA